MAPLDTACRFHHAKGAAIRSNANGYHAIGGWGFHLPGGILLVQLLDGLRRLKFRSMTGSRSLWSISMSGLRSVSFIVCSGMISGSRGASVTLNTFEKSVRTLSQSVWRLSDSVKE